jgi:hypothetical protein
MARRATLVAVVLALAPAGCGGGSYQTAPVSGQVLLDGKALPNAMVMFVPETTSGAKDPVPSSVGTTGEDGHYSLVLQSGANKDGAVVGKHKVVITLGAGGGSTEAKRTLHKQLPERYNRKTELVCDVPAAGRNDANFDLKSK